MGTCPFKHIVKRLLFVVRICSRLKATMDPEFGLPSTPMDLELSFRVILVLIPGLVGCIRQIENTPALDRSIWE